MIIERDVAIPTDDGTILRADIFRPDDEKPAPVIMTLGPYGKGVRYSDGYKPQWEWLMKAHPDVLPGCKFPPKLESDQRDRLGAQTVSQSIILAESHFLNSYTC